MDLQHTFTVPIGIDAAWAAFNDLEGIAPCFPGAVITSVDGDAFTGTAKVKLGPVALQYSGKGRWLSRDESAYRAVIEAVGKDKRGNGTASATITAHLESQGPALTTVVVDTDLRITGRPAQFGRGVIEDVGSRILDQFADCLSVRLGQDEAAGTGAAAPQPADTPSPTPSPTPLPAPVPPPAASSGTGSPGIAGDAGDDVPEVGATEPDADPTSQATTSPGSPSPATTSPASKRDVSAPLPVEPMELDLGGLVGPVLLQRYGPTAAACLVTAVITWFVARRLP